MIVIPSIALHLDTTALSDGTYELIPESDGGDFEAQVNTAVLTEAPDQSSEEPGAEIVSPRRQAPDITYISNYYHLLLLLTCAFTVLRI